MTWVNPVSSAWGHLQIGDSITAVDGFDLDNDGAVAYTNGVPLEQGCSFTDYINEKHVGESVQVRSLLGMIHQHAGEGFWWLWIVLALWIRLCCTEAHCCCCCHCISVVYCPCVCVQFAISHAFTCMLSGQSNAEGQSPFYKSATHFHRCILLCRSLSSETTND